jgi:hypothetical protein
MPRAELPSSLIGWLVAVVASLAGLVSGLLVIRTLGRLL